MGFFSKLFGNVKEEITRVEGNIESIVGGFNAQVKELHDRITTLEEAAKKEVTKVVDVVKADVAKAKTALKGKKSWVDLKNF